jgi:hypothetical protein
MKFLKLKTILATGAALSAACLSMAAFAGGAGGNISLPDDFRGWTHTKSVVTTDTEHPLHGFRNIYINDTGIQAMTNGTAYPDGSLIVMSFHEVVQEDGAVVQGKAIKYVLMLKDSGLTESNGWTYEAYLAGAMKPLVGGNVVEKCHGCHTAREDTDYVFSTYTE